MVPASLLEVAVTPALLVPLVTTTTQVLLDQQHTETTQALPNQQHTATPKITTTAPAVLRSPQATTCMEVMVPAQAPSVLPR